MPTMSSPGQFLPTGQALSPSPSSPAHPKFYSTHLYRNQLHRYVVVPIQVLNRYVVVRAQPSPWPSPAQHISYLSPVQAKPPLVQPRPLLRCVAVCAVSCTCTDLLECSLHCTVTENINTLQMCSVYLYIVNSINIFQCFGWATESRTLNVEIPYVERLSVKIPDVERPNVKITQQLQMSKVDIFQLYIVISFEPPW
jgi:hypothetical protein